MAASERRREDRQIKLTDDLLKGIEGHRSRMQIESGRKVSLSDAVEEVLNMGLRNITSDSKRIGTYQLPDLKKRRHVLVSPTLHAEVIRFGTNRNIKTVEEMYFRALWCGLDSQKEEYPPITELLERQPVKTE